MTKSEALAALDASVAKIVRAYLQLGYVSALVREYEDETENNVRTICPDTVGVAELLMAGSRVAQRNERKHSC